MTFLQQMFRINHVSSLWRSDGIKEYYGCPAIYLKVIACLGFNSLQLTGEKKLIKKINLCSDVHFSDGG